MSQNNIGDFLSQLNTINDEDLTVIKIPSTGKKVKFKPMSVKQHKDIIKTAMEGFDGNLKSNITYNNILSENSLEDVEFKVYDRNYILLNLRKNSIGEKVSIDENTYNINDLPVFNFDFETSKKISYKGIDIELEAPSITNDTAITEKAALELSKITNEDKKIKESVGVLLTHEIIKYIKTLTIGENIVNFDEMGLYDKKTIVEQLPLKLNNMIINYITELKEYEQSLLTFSNGTKLIIDASFLTGE